MTQTEQLIADLAATAANHYFLDEPADDETGRYFDWSARSVDGKIVHMEVGDGDDAVSVPMTRDEIFALQQRLTAWLLANQ